VGKQPNDPVEADLRALSRLSDPVRRRLYDLVARRDDPVSREAAARAVGISRSLAAYHLDTMVREGLLAVSYARTSGRTGPGAGRTSKLYRRSDDEFAVTVPPRDYELAAELLAGAMKADASGAAAAALRTAAHDFGVSVGRRTSDIEAGGQDGTLEVLRRRGYEPEVAADGVVRLRNCPFHRLVEEHRDLVCDMNLWLMRGLLEGLERAPDAAVLDPRPGYCCVALRGIGTM
jgi:predicted ArsR family transcriptional regulator